MTKVKKAGGGKAADSYSSFSSQGDYSDSNSSSWDNPRHARGVSGGNTGGARGKKDGAPAANNDPQTTHYLKYDLCKYFMANNCQRGPSNCQFSHQTKLFPCKWIHATGMCDKGENCRFSHNILNELELQKFMRENEEFLEEKLVKEGATNLGVYFIRFREERIK